VAPRSIHRSSCQCATVANSTKRAAAGIIRVGAQYVEFPEVDAGGATFVQQDRGNQVAGDDGLSCGALRSHSGRLLLAVVGDQFRHGS
jgi:hypothetical protein